MSWFSIAKNFGVNNIEKEFPIVTLYHGTYAANLEGILKNGIIPRNVDSLSLVNEGIQYISSKVGLSPEEEKELKDSAYVSKYAIDRLQEAGPNRVYLTGEKSYAISNSMASAEWFEEILGNAIRLKYAPYVEKEHNFTTQRLNLYKKLEELDKKSGMGDLSIYAEKDKISKEIRKSEQEENEQLSDIKKEMKDLRLNILRDRFGDKIVILTVELPYNVFKSKISSKYSQERLSLFEKIYNDYINGDKKDNWFELVKSKHYNVWDFFREVHLSGVEPEYITRKE